MPCNRISHLLILLGIAGCATGRQAEVLESQLRQQENVISQLNSEVIKLRTDLSISQQDAGALRNQLTGKGEPVIPAEQAALFYRITAIQIDELQSAWLPGESGRFGEISLLIRPIDEFQTALRIPGQITIALIPAGHKGAVAAENVTLNFPAEQIRPLWTSGWVSSGFLLQIDQQTLLPGQSQLLATAESCQVKITFQTADGREFTDEMVLKKPLDNAANQSLPVAEHPDQSPADIQPARFAELPSARAEKNADPFPRKLEPIPLVPLPTENRVDTSDRRTIEEFPIYR